MVVDGGGDSDNALTCCLDEEWNRKALCPPQALLQPGGGTGTRWSLAPVLMMMMMMISRIMVKITTIIKTIASDRWWDWNALID